MSRPRVRGLPVVLEEGDYVPATTSCGHNRPQLRRVWLSYGTIFPNGTRWLQYGCRKWMCRWRANYPASWGELEDP